MKRVDENELRMALGAAVIAGGRNATQAASYHRLINCLLSSLRRYQIWREEELHELVVMPLPLFPADDMHMHGWRPRQPGPESKVDC